jgi:hypothetical protein
MKFELLSSIVKFLDPHFAHHWLTNFVLPNSKDAFKEEDVLRLKLQIYSKTLLIDEISKVIDAISAKSGKTAELEKFKDGTLPIPHVGIIGCRFDWQTRGKPEEQGA